jgi:ribosome-binding ATPase YchF (GTP1/OBG family)
MQSHLENEQPLRLMDLTEEDEQLIRSYPLITRKELILVFNVAEDNLDDTSLLERVSGICSAGKMEAMTVSAKVESK